MTLQTKKHLLALALGTALLTTGCGGSSSSDQSGGDATINGVAMAGPVTGTVSVTDGDGNVIGTADVTDGYFSLLIAEAHLGAELDFEVTGTYVDEVSGETVTLSSSAPLALRLVAHALSGGDNSVGITPETTVIREMVRDGMSQSAAEAQFEAAFGYVPDYSSAPFDPTGAMPEGAAEGQQRSSFMLGAYSQWGNDLGLSGDELAALPVGIADDLADGELDGLDGLGAAVMVGNTNLNQLHNQSRLQARYVTAMASFAGSDSNGAGLDAPSSGLPGSGVTDAMGTTKSITLSDGSTLNVTLDAANTTPPFPMGPSVSRNVHRVTLTDGATGSAVSVGANDTITSLQASAMMHMLSGMSHATTYGANYTAASNGSYDFDIYYVMASSMMGEDGSQPMGVWDVNFTLTEGDGSSHSVQFHPDVTMAMDGSVLRAKGSSPDDAPMMNGEAMPRPYFVWLHEVEANSTGGYDIDLLVSTKQSMMNFPAVTTGLALGMASSMSMNMGMAMQSSGASPYVEGIALKLDLDGDGSYETTLDGSTNDGHFSASGITLNDIDGDGELMDVSAELTVTLGEDNDAATSDDQTIVTMDALSLAFKLPQ